MALERSRRAETNGEAQAIGERSMGRTAKGVGSAPRPRPVLGQTQRGHDRRGSWSPSGPANLTVGQYLESWLEDIEGTVRRHTYEQYKSVIGKHLIPEIGRTKLKRLSRPAIRKLYREKKQTGLSSRTVEYIHVTLHKALKDAAEDGLISTNPAQGLKLPQRDAKETKALSPGQVDRAA